ncbi:hypothetical protein EVAR_13013_1 [Eumeta japonica]|uniref:Uncharacterized protein n=1 Tax=Eumeta variegata TaxID=151549 RepID=A0A4C1TX00_EUMVA|nr:hypothetical protein EVAR_13013_1 [Eumeta japonica]
MYLACQGGGSCPPPPADGYALETLSIVVLPECCEAQEGYAFDPYACRRVSFDDAAVELFVHTEFPSVKCLAYDTGQCALTVSVVFLERSS